MKEYIEINQSKDFIIFVVKLFEHAVDIDFDLNLFECSYFHSVF